MPFDQLGALLRRLRGQAVAGHAPRRVPPAPCLLGIAMVKNEQDIIEPFVRHNLGFLDALVVADNGSVDATRDILVALARELDGLVVGDVPAFGYAQSEIMTALLHASQTAFFADYVLPLDADEFIGASDRAALLAALAPIPLGGYGLLPWQTHVLAADDLAAQGADPPRTMRLRRSEERPQFCKAVLRLDGHHMPDLRVELGNHRIIRNDEPQPPSVPIEGAALLHFPIRNAAQVAGKGAVGWMAYLAKNPDAASRSHGSQWRDIAARIASGDALTDAELADLSLAYAQYAEHPGWRAERVAAVPPQNYERRYSSGASLPHTQLIVRSWQQSLASRPPLLELSRPVLSNGGVPNAEGGFDAAWHWDNLFVDIAPFRFIAERYEAKSVLDVGCGIGAYLRLFQRLGAQDVLGLDVVPPEATALGSDAYRWTDLTQPFDLGRRFELVLCTEVAEHLDARAGDALIRSLAGHARQIVIFSAAEPGQPGHGHINCRKLAHWLALWRGHGWLPEATVSLGMRALATFSWFRRNLVVLRPASLVRHDGTERLLDIAERPFAWYGQKPGIRQDPFTEALPPDGGYPAWRSAPRMRSAAQAAP